MPLPCPPKPAAFLIAALAMACLAAAPTGAAEPPPAAKPADPAPAVKPVDPPPVWELLRDTRHLLDLIREGAESGQPPYAPIIITTNCDTEREWWSARCENQEALVPFTTTGPGNAVWDYVALFRILPPESEMEAAIRRQENHRQKHVALVSFTFIPEPFGLIDWHTARVEDGHVMVQTRHWTDREGHSKPNGPGTVRIDIDGGVKLSNVP